MGLFTAYYKKSDEELMILLQQGDHRAFEKLFDRYSQRLKGFFFRMLASDEQAAEDQVHELFTKLIERPELFKPGHSFEGWVFKVAANMCKNVYRRNAFETEYRRQLTREGIELPTIESEMDSALIRDEVTLFLQELDEDQRTLFLLKYQQDVPIRDLATLFDISEGTVKSRLFNIKKKIIQHVDKRIGE